MFTSGIRISNVVDHNILLFDTTKVRNESSNTPFTCIAQRCHECRDQPKQNVMSLGPHIA